MAKKSWWISCSVANYWRMIHGTSAWFTMEATGKHGRGKIQQSPAIRWSLFSGALIMDANHMWTVITRYGLSNVFFHITDPKVNRYRNSAEKIVKHWHVNMFLCQLFSGILLNKHHQPIVGKGNGAVLQADRPYQLLSSPYQQALYKHRQ